MKVSSLEEEGNTKKESIFCIRPPPPPPAPLSPVASQKSPKNLPPNINLEEPSKQKDTEPAKEDTNDAEVQSTLDIPDDDFGDFQTAAWDDMELCTFSSTLIDLRFPVDSALQIV